MYIHRNKWLWGISHIVVLRDGALVGTVQVDDTEKDVGVISGVSVVDNFRGKGFGNELLEALEHEAAEMGCKRIRLYADKNSFTTEWYQRHGYELKEGKVYECEKWNPNIVRLEKDI